MIKGLHYIKGLHGLRFFCAFLVLIFHCNDALNQVSSDLYLDLNILKKGERAVDFFFVLSGFLITYLALIEIKDTGTFKKRTFFFKRITRIFPLYYLSVFLGFLLIGCFYPLVYQSDIFEFPIEEGLIKYLLFLPNLVAAEYSNVGPLRSLWSIGVEEQFYIFFPFVILGLTQKISILKRVTILLILSLAIYFIVYYHFISIEKVCYVLITKYLRFHFILLGCLVGVIFFKYQDYLRNSLLKLLLIQLLIWSILITLLFLPNNIDPHNLVSASMFSFIILLFAANISFASLENKILARLGIISYGIYIFHPYVSIGLRFLLEKNNTLSNFVISFPIIFYLFVLVITIIVSQVSFKYFESYFLKLRKTIQ